MAMSAAPASAMSSKRLARRLGGTFAGTTGVDGEGVVGTAGAAGIDVALVSWSMVIEGSPYS
jgi:hypothetical protein